MLVRALLVALVLSWSVVGCGGSGRPSSVDPSAPFVGEGDVLVPLGGGGEQMVEASWGRQEGIGETISVLTDPGDLPELHVAGDASRRLPLKHTHVKAQLTGFVAEVEVAQTFENPFTDPIEVVYVFPLPENSAVGAMRMKIGERIVRAKIEERHHARHIYEQAKRAGRTAALLEQERPNVFTQSVANIAPGETIDVVIRYLQDLTYDAGQYEFVFPMVVGPRFIPGTPLAAAMSGTGTYADTDRVPDASRISPPVLGKGERSGHDLTLELSAAGALPVKSFEVPSHDVVTETPGDGSLRLVLAAHDTIPNRDFVLRYRVAGKEPLATLTTSGEGEGYFALVIQPPTLDVDELVGRRELIFVLDVSGSMSGVPIGMCKRAMRGALERLRPVDTFNVLTFAGATAQAFASPRPANAAHVERALAFVGSARAGGGTQMDNAVRAALDPTVTAGRHRYVFFLTDGYVGNEAEIIGGSKELVAALEARGQRARVFGFGVGSSVNRHLLDGLSRAGSGIAVYASAREDPARAVDQFFRYVDSPVLTDISIDWGDLGASEIYPQPIPDLFASRPIVLHGRHRQSRDATVVVRARDGERQLSLPVRVHHGSTAGPHGGVLGSLWARSKVGWIEEESWVGARPSGPEEITRLGLDFDLVTPYTSFVAVDESRVVGRGDPRTLVQPVETPEAVDPLAAGARTVAPRRGLTPPSQPAAEPARARTVAAPKSADSSPALADDDGEALASRSSGWQVDSPVVDAPSPAPTPAAAAAAVETSLDYQQAPAQTGEHGQEADEESPAPPATDLMDAEPSSRGCYCRAAAGHGDGGSIPPLVLAALLAGALARRRRRGDEGPTNDAKPAPKDRLRASLTSLSA